MHPDLLSKLTVKSKEEIFAQLSDIVHRHRRRFLRKNLRPCPNNCIHAQVSRKGVQGCSACHSRNSEQCRSENLFVPIAQKEELSQQFSEDLRELTILQHEYRDILVLLWVLGQLDGETPPEDVIANVEQRRMKRSNSDSGI